MSQLWKTLVMGFVAVRSLLPAPATLLPPRAVEGMTYWSQGSARQVPVPDGPIQSHPPSALAQVISNTPCLHNRGGGAGEERNRAGICP